MAKERVVKIAETSGVNAKGPTGVKCKERPLETQVIYGSTVKISSMFHFRAHDFTIWLGTVK
jgi:hypothetical protein